MSKNNTPPESRVSYGSGRLITENQMSHLEGVLLTIVESIGLQLSQENAVKSLIRNSLWADWYDLPYVDEVKSTEIRDHHNESIGRMNASTEKSS